MSDRRGVGGATLLVLLSFVFSSTITREVSGADLYTVAKIRVDERATDELTAKTQGIEKAQLDALQRLIEKITLRDDYDRLPELDAKAVGNTIRDFAVNDEKFGGGRYLADLSIRFKRRAVRELLRRHGLSIAETVSQPVVVLPVYRVAGSVLLWDDPNPWFNAWARRPPPDGLLPLMIPLGDYSDVAVISAEQALNGEEARLRQVAKKYDAIGTLVTVAELQIDPRSGDLAVQVSMTRFGRADAGRTFVRGFSAKAADGIEFLLREAVEALIIRAEEDWKRDNLQKLSGSQRLSVFVPLKSLGHWLKIRARLAQVSTIIEFSLERVSIKEAKVSLRYSGGPDQLRLAMAQSNLDFDFVAKRGAYVVRLGDKR